MPDILPNLVAFFLHYGALRSSLAKIGPTEEEDRTWENLMCEMFAMREELRQINAPTQSGL